MPKKFDPSVWGPHYWFFLHTVAKSYPERPNNVTKRKYYDLIQNMPLFIPDTAIGNKFSKMIDKYPVTPYLDCRESFERWVHFMHNRYNTLLGKDELTLMQSVDQYESHYRSNPVKFSEKYNIKKHIIIAVLIMVLSFFIYVFHK
jgi:FAD-linked sulfhydryl oxidase